MDAAELELDYENSDTTGTGSTQSISVRKNIPIKLKGKGRGKVRAKTSTPASTRNVKKNTTKKTTDDAAGEEKDENLPAKFDMEGDISKLEAPTFTTIDRGPPEPMHRNTKLRWDHKVNLIGEKVVNPMLHCCEKCKLPILIYGRMIPCKHVFCLDCAEKSGTACPRCKDKVQRVENTGLGTVHMCTFGGSRHGNNGCRRTYLSQRDLQAHVNHRHLRTATHHDASSTQSNSTHHAQTPTQSTTPQPQTHAAHSDYESRDPREARSGSHETVPARNLPQPHHPPVHSHPPPLLPHPPDTTVLPPPLPMTSSYHAREETHQPPSHIPGRPHLQFTQPPPNAGQPPPSHGYASPIPVMSTRTNLITVPIQDDTNAGNTYRSTHQAPPPYHHPPPPQQQPTGPVTYLQHPPPQHPYSHPPPSHLPVTYTAQGNQTPLVYANPGQVFNQPPPTHFPPPLLPPPSPSSGGPSMFAAPPPGPIHHPPPVGHGGPPPQYGNRPRFNPSGQPVFEDSHLSSSPYNVSGRPWARGPPPLRPLGSNPNIGPIQNRPPYYHQ